MFDVRDGLLGIISALMVTLGGCLSGGCTRAFGEATLEQQIEAFKQTTEHLVHLAERTDAAYTAEFEYDGEDAEAYLKQSAGLRVPVRVRLGVFGNAKQGGREHEAANADKAEVQPAGGCAVLREVSPKALGQGAGIQADVDAQVTTQRRDTVNDASLFWALVVNNTLVALGLPIIGGLLWYKRRQMQSWGAGGKP